jgi:hypothetical protein
MESESQTVAPLAAMPVGSSMLASFCSETAPLDTVTRDTSPPDEP